MSIELPTLQLEPVDESDRRRCLGRLLAPSGAARAEGAYVRAFERYLQEGRFDWELWRARRGDHDAALLLALLLGGRTGVLMIPHAEREFDPDDQLRLLQAWRARYPHDHFYYTQALIEPEGRTKHAVLTAAAYWPLTRLIYLDRDARYPWTEPPEAPGLEWLNYADGGDAVFAPVLAATYRESCDCPELSSLRPIEAAIAGHKSTGLYDSTLWEVALVDGAAAGVILLARIAGADALEVVYMGVAPEFRRHGVGRLLLRRAFERARATRARRVTLVVDARNAPARNLYSSFGFTPIAERDAYICTDGRPAIDPAIHEVS